MPADDIKATRDALQKLVGKAAKISTGKFENWSETIKGVKVLTCTPKSLQEVQAVIKGCRQLAIRIRAAGAGHSWSPIFADEGHLILNMKSLKRHDGPQIELIQNPEDDSDKHVNAMTSVTSGELMDFEIRNGVCLPANVILTPVTVGGLVTTMCHGTGKDCKTVSDYITSMRIVDSDGELRTYSLAKDGVDVMRAVRGNLGLLGIVYDVTFKMMNSTIVNTTNKFEMASKVFYDQQYITDLVDNNWTVQLLYFPMNGMSLAEITESVFERDVDLGEWIPQDDEVWVHLVNKAERSGDLKPHHYYKWKNQKEWIKESLGRVVDDIITTNPALTASFLQTQHRTMKGTHKESEVITQELPYAVHYMDVTGIPDVLDTEWAFDCDENYQTFSKALHYAIDKLKTLAADGKFPLNMAIDVRFLGHSDCYLSPASAGDPDNGGSGRVVYIDLVTLTDTKNWQELLDDVIGYWKTLPGARPHWSKQWSNINGVADHLKQVYKKQFAQFTEQVDKSQADPDGIFYNDLLEDVILPGGHQGWRALQEKVQNNNNKDEDKPKSKTCTLI